MNAQRDISEEHYSASQAMARLRVSRGSFYSLVNAGVVTNSCLQDARTASIPDARSTPWLRPFPLRRPPRIAPLLAAGADGERRGPMTIGPTPEQLATIGEVYWQSLYSTLFDFTGRSYAERRSPHRSPPTSVVAAGDGRPRWRRRAANICWSA